MGLSAIWPGGSSGSQASSPSSAPSMCHSLPVRNIPFSRTTRGASSSSARALPSFAMSNLSSAQNTHPADEYSSPLDVSSRGAPGVGGSSNGPARGGAAAGASWSPSCRCGGAAGAVTGVSSMAQSKGLVETSALGGKRPAPHRVKAASSSGVQRSAFAATTTSAAATWSQNEAERDSGVSCATSRGSTRHTVARTSSAGPRSGPRNASSRPPGWPRPEGSTSSRAGFARRTSVATVGVSAAPLTQHMQPPATSRTNTP
mmetsp:Transcript_21721/g.73840  ORF Transcript_21721/g.73840 Transcript_21721/m.73840 type:complete len:259 (-) Transcript_21721:231-1007(-)